MHSAFPRVVCNLLVNDVLRFCSTEPFSCEIAPRRLAELADLLGTARITRAVARDLLLRLKEGDFSPMEIAEQEGLMQISDEAVILAWAMEVVEENPKSVSDYKGGKSNALRALQGKLMGKSRGRANPVLAEKLLLQIIEGGKDHV
jgi:aspartyl-tRNA(Asn)/glutamyl-tRNA(Gln) amidotransferase subunit B